MVSELRETGKVHEGEGEKDLMRNRERKRERREMDEDTGDIICRGRTETEGDWREETEGSHMEGKRFSIGVCV